MLMGIFSILSILGIRVQVTIGLDKAPCSFSVFELIGSHLRGLRLPQFTPKQRDVCALFGRIFTSLRSIIKKIPFSRVNNLLKSKSKMMKKFFTMFFGLILIFGPIYSQVTIGKDTVPQPFSLLELISGNNKGLRLPQITTTLQRDAIFTNAPGFKTNPLVLGLQIYNMETKCVEVWNGTDWICMGEAPAAAPAWLLTGNAGTTPGYHFLGTTDDKDLVFKRNNVQAGWISTPNATYPSNGNNTAFGINTMPMTTTGSYNTAVGAEALAANTSGYHNSAFGYQALLANTTGVYNNAFGYEALLTNTTGNTNSAFGHGALGNNKTGSANSAFGQGALAGNASGSLNNAFGDHALYYSGTYSRNNAFGCYALNANWTGNNNSAFGTAALLYNSQGNENCAFGDSTLYSTSIGNQNAAFGKQALYRATGHNNTALGYRAGSNSTSGNNNITIGANTNVQSTYGSNQLNIGNIIYGINITTPTTEITNPGRIGIGTAAPVATLTVNGDISNNGSFWNSSDSRIKTVNGAFTDGLNVIKQIRLVRFHYNDNAPYNDTKTEQIGVMAQELEKIAPYMVKKVDYPGEEGKPAIHDLRTVNSQAYVFLLINAIQEQQAQIEKQQAQIEELKAQVEVLQGK